MRFLNVFLLCIGLIFSINCYTRKYQRGCTRIYFHSCELNDICDTSIEKIIVQQRYLYFYLLVLKFFCQANRLSKHYQSQ